MCARCPRWRCSCCARSRRSAAQGRDAQSHRAHAPRRRALCAQPQARASARAGRAVRASRSRSTPTRPFGRRRPFIIDRGEQVHTPEAAKAIAERAQAAVAPLEEEDDSKKIGGEEKRGREHAEFEAEAEIASCRQLPDPAKARHAAAGGGAADAAAADNARRRPSRISSRSRSPSPTMIRPRRLTTRPRMKPWPEQLAALHPRSHEGREEPRRDERRRRRGRRGGRRNRQRMARAGMPTKFRALLATGIRTRQSSSTRDPQRPSLSSHMPLPISTFAADRARSAAEASPAVLACHDRAVGSGPSAFDNSRARADSRRRSFGQRSGSRRRHRRRPSR